jgi:hypothetical protein
MGITTTNADGRPAIPLTEEQRYLFDTRGWLVIPGVLSEGEIAEKRDFCCRLRREPEALPEHARSSIGGPLEELVDHPVVLGFMNEFVAHPPHATEYGYGFRLEGSFLAIRQAGSDNFRPHGGGGMFNLPGNSHVYRCVPGRAHSGLTRVVWELNPVERGDGGTMFLTGSHKTAFPPPASIQDPRSPLWETYSCPAGSVLFFTEAITHTGAEWTNRERERVAIFNCYNTVGSKWHKWEPHPAQLRLMPSQRQTLFRPVYCQDNVIKEESQV